MDHASLMICCHARGETRVHTGELGAVEVGGRTPHYSPVATSLQVVGGCCSPKRAMDVRCLMA